MSDNTIKYNGTVLPKAWAKEVGKMAQDILKDYDNPNIEVTLEIEVHSNLNGVKQESITVTRSPKNIIWATITSTAGDEGAGD